MIEVFKPINGFEGIYEISNLGNVKSLKNNNYLLKPKTNHKGYKYFGLSLNKKDYSRFQHRLMAQAFIPNPENKPQINHINSIKHDNRIENLEWCTNGENQIHSYKNGKIAAYKNKFGKDHNQSKVVFIIKDNVKIEFENITRVSEYLKCTVQAVSNCLRGKTNTCRSYKCYYK